MAKKSAKSSSVKKAKSKRKLPTSKGAKKRSTKTSSTADYISLSGERWPLERDVLFRPDRLKYVRKLLVNDGCVFCRCANEPPQFETLCVYQTEWSMVVLNKYPYNSGHMLVLPRRHTGDLFSLSDVEYADLNVLVRKTMGIVKSVYEPAGFNVGMNHGRVSGAGIPDHLHYHIVPRWAGDLNFFPLIAETKAVIEKLETTFDRLQTSFQTEEAKGKIRK